MRRLILACALLGTTLLVGCGDKAPDASQVEKDKKTMLEPLDMSKVPADVKAKMGGGQAAAPAPAK